MPRHNNVPPAALAMALPPIDRDVEAMLRKSQPGYFSGEGDDVGKDLEEWLEKMEDYFDLALSSEANKAMMGRFKLEKSAKLWWQDHCRENALDPTVRYLGIHQNPIVQELPKPYVSNRASE